MKSIKRSFLIFATAVLAAFTLGHSQDSKAQDTAFNMRLKQRNAADNSDLDRYIAPPPTGSNCLFYFNGSTVLPSCAGIGSGLALTDGVLSSTAGTAQVNADWTATSGPSRILNKPTISTVGMTGQYGDLTGTPVLATVATSGAYADLSGRPALAQVAVSGAYADLSGKPSLATVATTGSYTDLANRPTIPSAPLPRAFAYRTPLLNTCFQLSTTRDTQVNYAVDVSTTLTLAGGARGSVYLRMYSDGACSTGQQTLISGSSGLPAALSVAVGLQNLGSVALPAIVPAAAWIRIETANDTGTPTFTARQGQEVQL